MHVHLLTTTDLAGPRGEDLAKLVRSLEAEHVHGVELTFHLLLQNCDETRLQAIRRDLPPFVRVTAHPRPLSLSAARNRLLGNLPDHAFSQKSVIAFPDDDCWYPPGFLTELRSFFTTHGKADLLVSSFSLEPVAWNSEATQLQLARFPIILRTASSNGMFFRGSNLASQVRFDENIGLGAKHNGGEDTDFAIRGYLTARQSFVARLPLVGHAGTCTKTLAKYYPGTTLAIAKHACRRPTIMIQFLRKIGVGVFLCIRGEIPAEYFMPALAEFRQIILGLNKNKR